MGRGRAKAKQTKVARRLKYYSPDTDLTALERELKGSEGESYTTRPSPAPEVDEDPAHTYRRGNGSPDGVSQPTSSDAENLDGDSESAGVVKPTAPPSITPGSWMKKQS
ncbi:hypothetical protein BH23ACT6_BH23ACT6_23490 [soil metagenome]